jgi:hypothetical protein
MLSGQERQIPYIPEIHANSNLKMASSAHKTDLTAYETRG